MKLFALKCANALEAQGIDPVKAFEGLPGLVEDLIVQRDLHSKEGIIWSAKFARCYLQSIQKGEG